ncbi:MAG: HD domain-containing protein [Candidatus Eremiobacteraeota bacterium]|nr:HD domain-containing protein [Candidatus Eremiobacteraeota bacterium]
MQYFTRKFAGFSFIAALSAIGLFVGTTLSVYHSVCARTYEDFLLRPKIGILLGALAACTHLITIWIIDHLTRGRYRHRPLLHALQLTVILYCYLMWAEVTFFPHKMQMASHRYWILAMTGLALAISIIIFFHYFLMETLQLRFRILGKIHMGIIESLITVLEVREPEKKGHSRRVAMGCDLVSARLGLPPEKREALRRAALMHDLGKIAIDDSLLCKEGRLNPEELAAVRLHPLIVEKILAPLHILSRETRIIKASHYFINAWNQEKETPESQEGIDRSIQTLFHYTFSGDTSLGTPDEAKILSAIDLYDTLTHPRRQRPVLLKEDALEEIRQGVGARFDGKAFEALTALVNEGAWPQDVKEEDRDEGTADEDTILTEIRKTARGLNLLDNFYRLLGVGRHRGKRSLILSMGSGLFLGLILGVFIYATTGDTAWIRLFFYQGIIVGLVVWSIGYPIEWYLAHRFRNRLFTGPFGAFTGFVIGGVPASIISLIAVINAHLGARFTLDEYSILYIVSTSLLCGALGAVFRYLQDVSNRLMKNQGKLQKAYFDLICALSFALEAKDPYTRGHSEKVSILAKKMGKLLDFDEMKLEELEKAALFHDIGKLGISQSIINKKTRLDDDELAIIKQHPTIGAEILEPVRYLRTLSPFVKAHHESFDGGGYPERKEKTDIPLYARIIAIADSYDAMVSDRSYRKGLPHATAIEELKKCSGSQFDPDLVKIFIDSF